MHGWTDEERVEVIDSSREKIAIANFAAWQGNTQAFEIALCEAQSMLGMLGDQQWSR